MTVAFRGSAHSTFPSPSASALGSAASTAAVRVQYSARTAYDEDQISGDESGTGKRNAVAPDYGRGQRQTRRSLCKFLSGSCRTGVLSRSGGAGGLCGRQEQPIAHMEQSPTVREYLCRPVLCRPENAERLRQEF